MFGSRVIDKKTDNETGMNSRIRMRLQPCYLRRKKNKVVTQRIFIILDQMKKTKNKKPIVI